MFHNSFLYCVGDRRLFQEFASNIYTFILNLWNNFTESFFRNVAQNVNSEMLTVDLEKALLTLRILRKLTIHGFYRPYQNEGCMSFLKVIFDRIRTSLECRKRLRMKGQYIFELSEKFIIHLTKILVSVLDSHPFTFVDFIQPTLELTVYYAFTPDGIEYVFERFVIQCFNLIKGILLCAEYRPAKVVELTKDPETVRAHQIKTNFFQPNTLAEICKKLVSHYFILTQDELDMWDNDPENFANDEAGESWKYSIRVSRNCNNLVFNILINIFLEF